MEFNIPLLQSLDDEPAFRVEKGIDADFQSLFYVPKLVDEPQNPIFDALQPISKGSRKRRNKPHQQDLPNLQLQKPPCPTPGVQSSVPADFWFAAAQNLDTENQILAWDTLRSTHLPNLTTPFLSEQDGLIYAVARQTVQPSVQDTGAKRTHVSQEELLLAFRMTVLGTSSIFHLWDSSKECFVPRGKEEGRDVVLLVDGKDEIVSASIVSRFLTIGTLMRRMESLIKSLYRRPFTEGASVYAFAHSLSIILTYLRNELSSYKPSHVASNLTSVWADYARYEEVLISISDLYERGASISPQDYLNLDTRSIPLLDRIYDHLHTHIERGSPRFLLALLAYILTVTSRTYFSQISRSIAYSTSNTAPRKTNHVIGEKPDPYMMEEYQQDQNVDQEVLDDFTFMADYHEDDEAGGERARFPRFFPKEVIDVLPSARKSLVLLRRANPDNPLLKTSGGHPPIGWFWTEKEINDVWEYQVYPTGDDATRSRPEDGVRQDPDYMRTYKPEIEEAFLLFDQEPGSHFLHPVTSANATSLIDPPSTSFSSFISSFPTSIPFHPITPTLSYLTSLVFSRFVLYASSLSRALLDYLLQSDGIYNIRSHFVLLREFFLLTSTEFEKRLGQAVFEGRLEGVEPGGGIHSHVGIGAKQGHVHNRTKSMIAESNRASGQVWAVGLAVPLLNKDSWPPTDSELSYLLRTTIVDSLDRRQASSSSEPGFGLGSSSSLVYGLGSGVGVGAVRRVNHGEADLMKDRIYWKVLEEAESRLGFAIRPQAEMWNNPLAIEALDFLYMSYKPPPPLDVLITEDEMSKYARVFAFLLRLKRIEHALHVLFLMSRDIRHPLFPTLNRANKRILTFRFISHQLVSNLLRYISDTVVAGNFDPFLARLSSSARETANSAPGYEVPQTSPSLTSFTSIFEVSSTHSFVLDSILSACLLRTTERRFRELLGHALKNILAFCIVAGERYRGRIREDQAEERMKRCETEMRGAMGKLIQALRTKLKQDGADLDEYRYTAPDDNKIRQPVGGFVATYHFLVRLDLGEWWAGVVDS